MKLNLHNSLFPVLIYYFKTNECFHFIIFNIKQNRSGLRVSNNSLINNYYPLILNLILFILGFILDFIIYFNY